MLKVRRFFVILSALVVAELCGWQALSPLFSREQEPYDFLETFLSARFKLNSGHFVASGILPYIPTSGKSTLEVWFDDRNWLGKLSNQTPFEDSSRETTTVLMNGPECFVQVGKSEILRCDRKTAKRYIGYFDVRSVGIALAAEMDEGSSVSEIIRSEGMRKFPTELLKKENGNVLVRRGPVPGDGFLIYEMDVARGFVPVSAQFKKSNGETQQYVNCKWSEHNGLWLPSELELVLLGKVRSQLSFTWEMANEPFSKDFFQPSSAFPGKSFIVEKHSNGNLRKRSISPEHSSSNVWVLTFLFVLFAGLCVFLRARRKGFVFRKSA